MSWNIADLTEHVVDTVPDRIALIVADEPRTYAELEERANRLAHHLAEQGIGPGDHVGIYGFNSHAFVETIFAAYKLRAIPINVNYRYVEAELRYLFDNADLVALVHDAQFAPRIAAVRDALPMLRHLVAIDDGSGVDTSTIGSVSYEEALAGASPARDFDAHDVWRAVEKYRIATLGITGDAMGRPLIEALDDGGYDASSLVAVMSTAAVFSATVKEQFHERFPNLVIADAVGSTETGYNGVRVIMKGGNEKPGLPTVRMGPDTVVLDDDMNVVAAGSGVVGRMARGGNVPLRYHKDPEKSAATFVTVNGRRYSVSGDSAVVEADGTMTLLGRGSVCIDSGGEKIYPEEVEAALKAHPAVFDVVVVGVPDERWGERVAAVIQGRPGQTVTLDDLDSHARAHVAGYKVPRELYIVDKIERSPSGKPDYPWAKRIATSAPR